MPDELALGLIKRFINDECPKAILDLMLKNGDTLKAEICKRATYFPSKAFYIESILYHIKLRKAKMLHSS